jgi:hypothetical protein
MSLLTATRSRSSSAEQWAGRLGRFGLACRGLVYLLVAWLAVEILRAPRANPAPADETGALHLLAHQTLGRPLVLAVALGFAGLAAWQVAVALTDHRLAAGGKAIAYAVLCAIALAVVVGNRKASGGQPSDLTARIMRHAAGRLAVGGAGVALMVGAAVLVVKALRRNYDVAVDVERLPPGVKALGSIGMSARGVAFGLIGWFLTEAAVTFDPAKAKSLDGALRTVASQPFGQFMLSAIALGLAAFGCISLIEAKYART